VHHEADGAGGCEHGDLRVAEAEAFTVGERRIPALLAGFDQCRHLWSDRIVDVLIRVRAADRRADLVDAGAVHADHVEERLAIDVEARAGAAGNLYRLRARSRGAEWRALLSDAR